MCCAHARGGIAGLSYDPVCGRIGENYSRFERLGLLEVHQCVRHYYHQIAHGDLARRGAVEAYAAAAALALDYICLETLAVVYVEDLYLFAFDHAGGIEQAKANKFQVAYGSETVDSYEAPYIHKRGDYYYLFCSTGTCCDGLNSTYTTVVARSTSLFGPYVNAEGKSMLDGLNHEVVILKNDDFVGTGHNAEIVQDDAGNDWILYHAYVAGVDQDRVFCLDRVYWDEVGWPYVLGNGPSVKAEAPVFN